MDGRGCDAKDLRSPPDIDQVAVGRSGFRVMAWNLPRASQISDATGVEAVAISGGLALAIEDSGNDLIGMQLCETANKVYRIFVGAKGLLAGTGGTVQFDPAQQAGVPAQGEMDPILAARRPDDHFLKHRAQQFLLVACRGCGGVPDTTKIRTEREDCIAVGGIEQTGPISLAVLQLLLGVIERLEASLPFRFQSTCNQAVFRIDRTIATFGPCRLVACPFDRQPPCSRA